MMQVYGHRLPARYAMELAHVREVAPVAVRLVEREMSERAGQVEVAVTSGVGAQELLLGTQQAVLGTRNMPHRRHEGALGHTTLSTRGTLIVVEARQHDGDLALLDETIVHELVHAVQFNRRGAREAIVQRMGSSYGLVELSGMEREAAEKQFARNEDEAVAMERLARRFSKAVA